MTLSDQELLDALLRRPQGLRLCREAVMAAAAEHGRRPWPESDNTLQEPGRVWELLHNIRGQPKEHFVAFYLNARNRLIAQETVSIGTLTASLVHPREVFAPALEKRAAALIVAHNHPSGDLHPSPEDREATRRLSRAAGLLGIGFLDHVVVGEAGYFSFRREGFLN